MNHLYLGDCLFVLRENIKSESVDLIYIDPPFNSKRDYNIFFDDKEIQTQKIAFEDTWTLKNIQDSLAELLILKTENLYKLLTTYQEVAPHAFPYLVMMSLRILELHRVLKPTGSFFLHCDPNMSHYLKTICDVVFGSSNYLNEIVWKRTFNSGSSKSIARKYPVSTDVILFYTKSSDYIFNKTFRPYSEGAIKRYDKVDEYGRRFKWNPLKTVSKERLKEMLDSGEAKKIPTSKYPVYKHYFDETKGAPIDNLWNDIEQMGTFGAERLGYPTQKPRALLERIIQASSNEEDIVLDAFCGCGTTVDAAESLHRKWIGIDVSPFAISLIKRRLRDTYGEGLSKFEIRGTPIDEASAIELWRQNANAFQDWWLTELEVFSTTFGTKGADKGIDGIAQFLIEPKTQKIIRAAFSVKGGENVESKDIDALWGAMEKHKCELGVFLTIAEPTAAMVKTVAGSGFVDTPEKKFPRLQVLTLNEYFKNHKLKLPKQNVTFKAAQLKGKSKQNQIDMGI